MRSLGWPTRTARSLAWQSSALPTAPMSVLTLTRPHVRLLGSEISAHAAVYLDAPADQLVARLLNRARIEGRPDDTPDVIRHRLRVFQQATQPLVEFYRSRTMLHVVDATRSEDAVTEAIIETLAR
jgi:adenylate kinase family enzyme